MITQTEIVQTISLILSILINFVLSVLAWYSSYKLKIEQSRYKTQVQITTLKQAITLLIDATTENLEQTKNQVKVMLQSIDEIKEDKGK